jgi:hypothetical protein
LNIEYLVSVKGNRVEFNKNSIAVEDDWVRVLFPINEDKWWYIRDILKYKKVKQIRNIPYLAKVGKLSKFQTEYFMRPEDIANPKSKTIKYDVKRIIKEWWIAVELTEFNKDLFYDCNAERYKEQTILWTKFRLNWKRKNEWILDNYKELKEKYWCYVVWCSIWWKIYSFTIWCMLSEKYAIDFTVRYRRGRWYADFARIERAKHFLWKVELMNDWTADTKWIKESKSHLAFLQRDTYGFELN